MLVEEVYMEIERDLRLGKRKPIWLVLSARRFLQDQRQRH